MRINIHIQDNVLELIDKQAEKMGISRSAFISVCCTTQIHAGFDDISTLQRQAEANEFTARSIGKVYDEQYKKEDNNE